ncbi:class IV adenylate cyclase [Halalkalicoccus subterraneus]|uniref:class IV adenylate cyclase n=1 Tax=Halalkalicoccus subterraneus TaxID=2675002 RepID=UPI000EFACD95|nr:class IV adenylate cyclase [Halalkalicoccus subterraneus]
MYEVEMKLRAEHERLHERLERRGANRIDAVTQRDTYYDAPTRDFAETDEALRIRRETRDGETRATLTYKGPLVGETSKTREERETDLSDGDVMGSILDSLGFSAVETVEKRRERFSLEGYTVTLDTVTDLGTFVEIETEAIESDLDAARKGVGRTVESLGLDPADEIRTSYLELLIEDGHDRE